MKDQIGRVYVVTEERVEFIWPIPINIITVEIGARLHTDQALRLSQFILCHKS